MAHIIAKRVAVLGQTHFDAEARMLSCNGKSLHLSLKDALIVSLLLQSPTQSLSKSEICTQAWESALVGSKKFDTCIFNLRMKLADIGMDIQFKPADHFRLCLLQKCASA